MQEDVIISSINWRLWLSNVTLGRIQTTLSPFLSAFVPTLVFDYDNDVRNDRKLSGVRTLNNSTASKANARAGSEIFQFSDDLWASFFLQAPSKSNSSGTSFLKSFQSLQLKEISAFSEQMAFIDPSRALLTSYCGLGLFIFQTCLTSPTWGQNQILLTFLSSQPPGQYVLSKHLCLGSCFLLYLKCAS